MSVIRGKINLFILIIYASGDLFIGWHSCEVFTSVAQMEYLVDYQFEFYKILRNHVKSSQAHLEMLRSVFHEMNEFDRVIGRTSSNSAKNKTCDTAERLLKIARIIINRRKLVYNMKMLTAKRKKLLEHLSSIRERFPTEEDLEGAAIGILRLQETYNLDSDSFMKMTSQHGHSHPRMHLDDLFYLGRTAYLNNKMMLTSQWMKLALQSSDSEDGGYLLGKSSQSIDYDIDIRDHLVFAEYKLGNYRAALNYTKEILIRDPENQNALENIKVIKDKLKDENNNNNNEQIQRESKYGLENTYEVLCRGESSKMKKRRRTNNSKLVCGYKNKDPRIRIRPIKYEIVSTAPEIYIFHQMATNYEVKVLKRLAFPQLQRATVSDIETNKLEVASYRISKSGWLSDRDHEIVSSISQRMEAATGLSSKTAEDLQVANYGIGGHYEPHFDWSNHFENSEMEKFGQGNRIATCLLYLNDIQAGGATVFMEPKLAILPQKGSMAFWYNLYRNGTGKENTVHAACPVLLGSKWVANKWFHERGQEYTRPCALKRTQ